MKLKFLNAFAVLFVIMMSVVACEPKEEKTDEVNISVAFKSLVVESSSKITVSGSYIVWSDNVSVSEVGVAFKTDNDAEYYYAAATEVASPFTVVVSGLSAGTTYSYKNYVKVGEKYFFTPTEKTFTTDGDAPDVNIAITYGSIHVDSKTQISASGTYLYSGEEPITEVGIAYRTDASTTYFHEPASAVASPFTVVVDNLTADITYYYKLYAKVAGVYYYTSSERSFAIDGGTSEQGVTLSFGTMTKNSASQVTVGGTYSLLGDGTVLSEVGVAIKATSEQTYSYKAASKVATPFSVVISGLSDALTYQYKLYAKIGTEYHYTTTEQSFTLGDGGGGDGGETTYKPHTGWAELPASYVDDNLYYAFHLSAGGEKTNGHTRRNYSVCYSAKYHCPVWVAAPMHNCYTGSSGRNDSYRADPDIPSSIQQYSKSFASGYNKGHMLGSGERTVSVATNKQVFYYSNIAPQLSSTFNTGGGAWNNLEGTVDGYWCSDTLYQVIGCYFDKYTDAYGDTATPKIASCGGQPTAIPTMFYKALLRTKTGKTGKSVMNCSASELKCVAFVMRHTMSKGHEPQSRDMISIADLEKLTGFTFFTNVPNAPKTTFTPSEWGM